MICLSRSLNTPLSISTLLLSERSEYVQASRSISSCNHVNVERIVHRLDVTGGRGQPRFAHHGIHVIRMGRGGKQGVTREGMRRRQHRVPGHPVHRLIVVHQLLHRRHAQRRVRNHIRHLQTNERNR